MFPENAGFTLSLRMHDHSQLKETVGVVEGTNTLERQICYKSVVTKYMPNRVARACGYSDYNNNTSALKVFEAFAYSLLTRAGFMGSD